MATRKKTAEIAEEIQAESVTVLPREIVEKFSSGNTVFDLILGGGFPVGKIVNIVGDSSSGKTLIACEAIAAARKQYGGKLRWRYNDAEAGFSFDSKLLYGFEIVDQDKAPSTTIEDFELDLHRELEALAEGETLVYVLDSLDSLSSLSEVDAAVDRRKALAAGKEIKGSYGMTKQKSLSEFFRLQASHIKDKRCTLIIISQVRENIGVMYGPRYRRSGGKALDFYAAQIVWLAEAEKKEKRGRAVGITTRAKITKNKVGLPFRSGFLDILFDYGVDDVATNLNYLCDARTDTGKLKKNAIYKIDEKSGDLDTLVQFVENYDIDERLQFMVQEKWHAVDAAVSASHRKPRY